MSYLLLGKKNSYFFMFSDIGTGCPQNLCSLSPFLEVLRPDWIKRSVTWSVLTADHALSRPPEVFSKLDSHMPLCSVIQKKANKQDYLPRFQRFFILLPTCIFRRLASWHTCMWIKRQKEKDGANRKKRIFSLFPFKTLLIRSLFPPCQ